MHVEIWFNSFPKIHALRLSRPLPYTMMRYLEILISPKSNTFISWKITGETKISIRPLAGDSRFEAILQNMKRKRRESSANYRENISTYYTIQRKNTLVLYHMIPSPLISISSVNRQEVKLEFFSDMAGSWWYLWNLFYHSDIFNSPWVIGPRADRLFVFPHSVW